MKLDTKSSMLLRIRMITEFFMSKELASYSTMIMSRPKPKKWVANISGIRAKYMVSEQNSASMKILASLCQLSPDKYSWCCYRSKMRHDL